MSENLEQGNFHSGFRGRSSDFGSLRKYQETGNRCNAFRLPRFPTISRAFNYSKGALGDSERKKVKVIAHLAKNGYLVEVKFVQVNFK